VLVAKSNAGIPKLVNGKAAYLCEPQEMGGYSRQVREAGARIIGGCCGNTPAHLKAMAEALGVA
jgi:methionine synthase I (cobalamin-dependent)